MLQSYGKCPDPFSHDKKNQSRQLTPYFDKERGDCVILFSSSVALITMIVAVTSDS